MMQSKSSPSMKTSSSSGGKSSGRFAIAKLILPIFSVAVACYLAHEYVVGKGVKVSSSGIDHHNKLPTSTTTALDQITDTLTKEGEQDTRRAVAELNDLPRNYRGEKQDQQLLEETWEASMNVERKVFLSENNDNGGQNNYSFEEGVDEDPANRRQEERILQDWMHRAADGCLKNGELQVDKCLASEHTSDVAVNCCKGSMEKNNLKCQRHKKCVKKKTFAAAEKYCEDQGMRLCSVAELERGACCGKGCNWDNKISWTSDRCETTSSLSSSSSSQPSSPPSLQPTPSPSSLPSLQPTPSPSNQPSSLPSSVPSPHPSPPPSPSPSSRSSLRPSFQPTFTPSSQPTAIVTSLSISSSSNSFTTSEAVPNPSFALWKIITLALVGVLFCFAAVGCHFVQKDRENEEESGWWPTSAVGGSVGPPSTVEVENEEESGWWPTSTVGGSVGPPSTVEVAHQEEGHGLSAWLSKFLDEHNL